MNERTRRLIIDAIRQPLYNREGRTNRNLPREPFNHDIRVHGRFGITDDLFPFYDVMIIHENDVFPNYPRTNDILQNISRNSEIGEISLLNNRALVARIPIYGLVSQKSMHPAYPIRNALDAMIVQSAVGANAIAYLLSNAPNGEGFLQSLLGRVGLRPQSLGGLNNSGYFSRRLNIYSILYKLNNIPGSVLIDGINSFNITDNLAVRFSDHAQSVELHDNAIVYPTVINIPEEIKALTPFEFSFFEGRVLPDITGREIPFYRREISISDARWVWHYDDDGIDVPTMGEMLRNSGAIEHVREMLNSEIPQFYQDWSYTSLALLSDDPIHALDDWLYRDGISFISGIENFLNPQDREPSSQPQTIITNTIEQEQIAQEERQTQTQNNRTGTQRQQSEERPQQGQPVSALSSVSELLSSIDEDTRQFRSSINDIIKKVAQDIYDSLEKKRPAGGGHTRRTEKLITSERGKQALTKLIEHHPVISPINSLQFSNSRGAEGIITLTSEIQGNRLREELAIGGYTKGHIVKDNFYKIAMDTAQSGMRTHLWRPSVRREDITGRRLENSPGLKNNIRNFNINSNNVQIINVPDGNIRQLENAGIIVPVENDKAIFIPGFADITHTFGLEFELKTNVRPSEAERRIKNRLREQYGIDIDDLSLNGRGIEVDNDASVHNGHEIVTGIFTGITGVKAMYYLGKALQDLGYSAGMNRRGDTYGLHVNIGSVPEEFRKQAVKFGIDYLRLTEDFYKRAFISEARYNSRYYNMLSFLTNGIPEESRQVWKHFWFSGISKFRKLRGGQNEYQYLREHGEYPSNYNLRRILSTSSYIPEKVAKYKTMSLHKLLLNGIGEFRIFDGSVKPDIFLNQLFVGLKMFKDIYNGARNRLTLPETDRLIPPENGWTDADIFKNATKAIMGINDETLLDYLWKFHNRCRNATSTGQI